MKTGVKKRDNPYVCWGLTAFCVLLACILAFLLLSNLGKVFSALGWFCSALSPVLYGLAFGYLLHHRRHVARRAPVVQGRYGAPLAAHLLVDHRILGAHGAGDLVDVLGSTHET